MERTQDSENVQTKKVRESRNKDIMRAYEVSEEKKIAEDLQKFGDMRRCKTHKKVRATLHLALSAEGKEKFLE